MPHMYERMIINHHCTHSFNYTLVGNNDHIGRITDSCRVEHTMKVKDMSFTTDGGEVLTVAVFTHPINSIVAWVIHVVYCTFSTSHWLFVNSSNDIYLWVV